MRSFPAAPAVLPALRDALRLVRAHWFGWLVLLIAAQAALQLLVLPLLATAFRAALSLGAIDGINQVTIVQLLSDPVSLLALLVYAVLAVVAIVAQLALVTGVAHAILDGEPFSARTALSALGRALRALASWQAPLLALYAVLLLPLSQLGLGASLTSHIAIPAFISGELSKTPLGAIVMVLLSLGIAYLALRLVLTLSVLLGERTSILAAMRRSFALTRGRTQLALLGLLVVLAAATGAIVVLLVLLGALPVAAVSGDPDAASVTTTAVLAVAGSVRFLAVGLLTAILTCTLVVLHRAVLGRATLDPTADEPTAGTRWTAGIVLGLVAAIGVGQTAAAIAATPSPDGRTMIVAHRGYAAGGVENSIEALRAAAEAGADMVELDIQETADGGLVVIHDTDLGRLAGRDEQIYELTTAEATAVELHQGAFTTTIPSFEAFAAEAERLGMPLLVEIKPHGHEAPAFAQRVVDAVAAADPSGDDWIQTLDRPLLDEVLAAAPDRAAALVVGLQLGDLPSTDASAVVLEDWSYADAMLAVAHEREQQLLVWTVNDPALQRSYVARGVDGIITDEVGAGVLARELRDRIESPVGRYLDRAERYLGL